MANNPTNLDLSTVPNEDYDTLAVKIEDYYKSDSTVKSLLSYHWERNHLMLDGKQWLVFDGDRDVGGTWKRLKVSPQNEFIPRPVTNYIFDAYQTLKSYLLKSKPRSTVRPNTQTYKDRTASKLAQLVLESNYEKLKEQYNYEYAASNLIIYGTVFKKSYWDTSVLSMAKIPRMESHPVIDANTGLPTGQMEEKQARDPLTGDLAFDEIPLGDVNTEIVEPYRIAIDPLASDVHNARWIMEYAIQPLQYIKEVYGKQEPGYTGLVDEVKEEKNLSTSLKRFFNLKTSSGVKMGILSSSTGGSAAEEMIENAAVVKQYYERPSPEHIKGRLIVVANGIVLYSGDSPCEGSEQGDWHPYSECRWELVPGRFWGKSPLDDACEIQKQVNSIDSVIILTRKTMAIPQKLIPIGSGIEPGVWTGRPGAEIRYRDAGTGNKPETIPPVGVDAQIFQEREQRVQDIKNVTGAIDILKGERPPGVTAASALNMLYEVGTGKLFPILDRWKMFIECDQKKQLKLVSQKYREPRPQFIQLLKSKNEDLSPTEIDSFIGTDLYDNCNVVIEAGSNVPKLQSTKQMLLMEVANTGSLALEIPENRMKFLEDMGIPGYTNEISPDIKRAEWENSVFDDMVNHPERVQAAMVLDIDDHPLHMEVHKRRMKEPAFMDLPFEVQQQYMMHLAQHQQKEQEKMMQQQMQAMLTGMPPAQDPGKNTPQNLQASGKGLTAEAKKEAFGGDIPPGTPQ